MIINQARIDHGYRMWGERLDHDGWTPYLLTFMFRHVGGSDAKVARQMEREVERVYATLLSRVVRKPTAPSSVERLPVWLCFPDLPVFKHEKQSSMDMLVNNGRHTHTVAFDPPWSRLQVDLATHFDAYRDLYVRQDMPLIRIDAEPITHRIGYVIDYARKSIRRGLIDEDASFVLPRVCSELINRVGSSQSEQGTAISPLSPHE